MAVVLALVAAAAFGVADFLGGIASRRSSATAVTTCNQALGLGIALAILPFATGRVTGAALGWGALGGIGSAIGLRALYRGFAAGRMSVVATLSAVIAAVIPAVVGVLTGDRLGVMAAAGIIIAVPAIGLVAWQSASGERGAAAAGALHGAIAGCGFALLLIALDRARLHSGVWPLVISQTIALALVLPSALRGERGTAARLRAAAVPAVAAGILAGTANVLFLVSTRHGLLAIVAVLTSLYPAATVLLARFILGERWGRTQAAGLLTAALAVALVSLK
jgi:drug/metabolite transporter (DMT)-like permease